MSNPDLKEIENHIKDLLFNNTSITSPPAQSNLDIRYKLDPFPFDDKCLLTNVEDEVYKGKHIHLNSSLSENCCSSQLIDLNVLTNFAAKHADVTSEDISKAPRILPHPDLENYLTPCPSTSISNEGNFIDGKAEINKAPGFISKSPPNEGFKRSNRKQSECSNPDVTVLATFDKKNQKKNNRKNQKKLKKQEKATQRVILGENRRRSDSNVVDFPNQGYQLEHSSPKKEDTKAKDHSSPSKQIPNTPEKRKESSPQKQEVSQSRTSLPADESVIYALVRKRQFLKFSCAVCDFEARSKDGMNKHLHSDLHKELQAQIESDKILPYLPRPLPSQVEAITQLLLSCHSQFGLQSEDLAIRETLAARLKDFVEKNVPGCTLEMVGSSIIGLGLKTSKVDFVLKVESEKNVPDSLELLYKTLLADSSFCDVESDFKKKRLGILFSDRETQLSCSIVLDTGVSEKFSRLLAIYSQLDPRVPVLGTNLRYWAKICGIDNQYLGTLPAYSYSLLLVYFLQQVPFEPPVLPVVHELKEYGNADFIEDYVKGQKWKSENTYSLGELWIKFFHFYNFTYELGKHVISIRNSKIIMCSDKNWTTKFYAIEDPFLRRNVAHVIPSFQVCQYIQLCFLRTYRYFAYPQIKKGKIKIIKTDAFVDFLLTECYATNKSVEEEPSEESVASDNDDSLPDESGYIQDFEDQDPDLPIENVILTLKNMDLEESDYVEQDIGMPENVPSAVPPQKVSKADSPKKSKEKSSKQEERRAFLQNACSWDLGDLQVNVDSFTYKMDPITFKGKKDLPYSCKDCKSSNHTKKNCPKEELPPRSQLPEMTPDFMRIINKILHYIKDKNCVDDEDRAYMTRIMKGIEDHIQKTMPDASLSMFGSFCNGFGFKNRSDMDFCLTFKGQEDSKNLDCTEVIENVALQLKQFPKLENIIPVTSAKVPIVKFFCTESGLEGDISLYNTLAIANTEMLEAYSKIDPRVQILGYALKYFAKVLGICDASRGSLSSYAYILMVIFFLQQRQPPVIPVLQELHNGEIPSETIDGWNVWFYKELDKLPKVWPDYGRNVESAGELWLGLLSFYAHDFDWKEYVVSIRQKALLTRFRKLWITDQIAIEDPFDLNHNLGAGLSRKMNMYIFKAFIKGRERFGTPLSQNDMYTMQGHEVSYLFERRFLNGGLEPPHDRGCRTCGKIGHIAKNCTQKKACACCKKLGHLVKNCPQKQQQKRKQKQDICVEPHSLIGHPLRKQINEIQRNSGPPPDPSNLGDDRDGCRKLMQMGFPSHRHPPPGFAKNFKSAPPGFNQMHPMHPMNTNFPRPFPPSSAPQSHLQRMMPLNDLSHSPPKHYNSSPSQNYQGNVKYNSSSSQNYQGNSKYHKLPEPMGPPMGIRSLLPEPVGPAMGIRSLLPEPRGSHGDPRLWQNRQQMLPNKFPSQYMDSGKGLMNH